MNGSARNVANFLLENERTHFEADAQGFGMVAKEISKESGKVKQV
jgi:hypothetical protein